MYHGTTSRTPVIQHSVVTRRWGERGEVCQQSSQDATTWGGINAQNTYITEPTSDTPVNPELSVTS